MNDQSQQHFGFHERRIFLPLLLALSFASALFAAVVAPPAFGQTYYREVLVSKQCGRCGRSVSLSSRVGQSCPHCGARWGYETTTRRTARSHNKAKRPSRKARRTAHPRRTAQVSPQRVYTAAPVFQPRYVPVQPVQIRLPEPTLVSPLPPAPVASFPPITQPIRPASLPLWDDSSSAVERIRSGAHGDLPTPTLTHAAGAVGEGLSIQNDTGYTLRVYFRGPSTRTVSIAQGQNWDLDLPVGSYEVAGEIPGSGIQPFYGRQSYQANTRYSIRFFVVRR